MSCDAAHAAPREQKLVEKGDRVKLACPRGKGARARDNLWKADFRWYHNDRRIALKPTRTDEIIMLVSDPDISVKGNKLIIRKAQFHDAGNYSCFVLVPKPPRWYNYTVLVTQPPQDHRDDDYDYMYDDDDYMYDDYGYLDDYYPDELDYEEGDYGGQTYGDYPDFECDADHTNGTSDVTTPWNEVMTSESGVMTSESEVVTSENEVVTSENEVVTSESDVVTPVSANTPEGTTEAAGPEAGSVTVDGHVTAQKVQRPRAPYFEDPASLKREVSAPLGTTVTIQCPVKGFPQPRVQWLFNSRPVSDLSTFDTRSVRVGRTCIRIRRVTTFFAGNFSCEAENGLGTAHHTTKLTVSAEVDEVFPAVTPGWPRDVSALAGGPVTLRCPGLWGWDMDLFWVFHQKNFNIKDMVDLSRIHNNAVRQYDSRYDISVRDQLTIRNASAHDTGLYTCIKLNNLGFNYSRARVEILPEVPETHISVQPLNASAGPGASVTLRCPMTATGGPREDRVTVFWLYSETEPARITSVPELQRAREMALTSDRPNTTDPTPASTARPGPAEDPTLPPVATPTTPTATTVPTETDDSQLVLTDLQVTDTGFYTCVAVSERRVLKAWTHLEVLEEEPPRYSQENWLIVSVTGLLLGLLTCAVCTTCLVRQLRRLKTLPRHRVVVEDSPDSLQPRVRIERQTPGCKPLVALLPDDPTWELDRKRLELDTPLGEGCFGRVLRGRLSQPDGSSDLVAVKMLKDGFSDSDLVDFVCEMELMKKIGRHVNIVNLLGTCTRGDTPLVVIEYARYGNLQTYLRERREMPNYERPFDLEVPTLYDLTQFGFQAARGMEYLAAKKCVHRDLAARNVLIAENGIAKIADFGLARDVRDKDYYRKVTDGRLPVKWMAPEALLERLYTSQSDVWSFGVLLWEILTMGAIPYAGVQSVPDLIASLKAGERLARPTGCPEEL
ncbi:Fibroblast growth factor receptor 3 [Amphibalanus amphitrite]|uniref:receptor protein-tyrosine kinase n=1 Tax=Amphibalanus amphitrite TaxID=1232801 RepID=A0A6A4WVA4_AMPAM|nr:Fibroblast growth factor receptor 3 [Amphibalanus amphitrite]